MTKVPLIDYLKKNGFDYDCISDRYVQILIMLHIFLKKRKLGKNLVIVNGNNLIRAVVDYFVDVIRIKEFHPIDKTNREKIFGYMAYWLLKRKPLQAVKDFDGCDSINELFVADYILSMISNERKIVSSMKKENSSYKNFAFMLYYHLKYRLVTQQSIELMIDAFFCGYDFVVQNTVPDSALATTC